jgi:hypothetical protein
VAYVNEASPNAQFPYASWETAATNIQQAIQAETLPGRLVLVTNGVYRLGTVEWNGQNRVALSNAVVVRSVNGPRVTVIEGAVNGVRCAYVGAGSLLSGFTLRNGSAESGGGVTSHLVLSGRYHRLSHVPTIPTEGNEGNEGKRFSSFPLFAPVDSP